MLHMLALLLATSTVVTVSCEDINALVGRAKSYPDLTTEERTEIIDLYYEFAEKQGLYCQDAND